MHDSLLMHGLVCCTETIFGYKIHERTNKLTDNTRQVLFYHSIMIPSNKKFVNLLLLEAGWKNLLHTLVCMSALMTIQY